MDDGARLEQAERRLVEARTDARSLAATNDRLTAALREARSSLEGLKAELAALSVPPHQRATLLRAADDDGWVEVMVGARILRTRVAAEVDPEGWGTGTAVWLNESGVVVGRAQRTLIGEVATVLDVLPEGRLVVAATDGTLTVVTGTPALLAEGVLPGGRVLLDRQTSMAHERLDSHDVAVLSLDEVPGITWDDIGGLDRVIAQVRDAVELPFQHPELFRAYDLDAPRGILLYGPPGCGKTMIARAVANATGSAFLNVKGPELLNKYVGETERLVREVFARARQLAGRGRPVVVFFDEMDALFRTRGTGVSSDMESTVVPALLTELDGVEELRHVTVIGATNREDLIDPAILRPGRLDVKIRLDRPGAAEAEVILGLHLGEGLPWQEPDTPDGLRASAIRDVVADLYARVPDREFLEVTYASGEREVLYVGEFVSGAMLANIARRAKLQAVKDQVAGGTGGLRADHLARAVRSELRENEDLPGTANPEDWSRVAGRRGERIVLVRTLAAGEGRGVRVLDT